jgi:hypothetical protein
MHAAESIFRRAWVALLIFYAVVFPRQGLPGVVLAKAAGATSPDALATDGLPLSVWHAYRGDEERALAEVLRAYTARTGMAVEVLATTMSSATTPSPSPR